MRPAGGAAAADRPGRLRGHHHGRQDRRPHSALRDDDGVVPPRAHRAGPGGGGRHVRDHGLVHARRARQRRPVRPAAGARGVSAHGGAEPPPVPHQRRLHRRADLQRQALERLHERRAAAVGQRAVCDAGTARRADRHRLRAGGRDHERAVHRRVAGAARRAGNTCRAAEFARRAVRRPAPQRRRDVPDRRHPARPGALPRRADLVLADPGPGGRAGARAGRPHRRSARRNRRSRGNCKWVCRFISGSSISSRPRG